MVVNDRIILALDVKDLDDGKRVVKELSPDLKTVKIGPVLFTKYGPGIIDMCLENGLKIFLDLKFHDIPNTVMLSCLAAVELKVSMLTLHASGGREMMSSASDAVRRYCEENHRQKPYIIGITMLTSMTGRTMREDFGIDVKGDSYVERLGLLAKESGIDGVVCSPNETRRIKEICGKNFIVINPGIRPAGVSSDEQKRIDTPGRAIENGADYIVVGRPVLNADDRRTAFLNIAKEAEDAAQEK